MTGTLTETTYQYRTIEQRRAALYKALMVRPTDTRLRELLIKLTTPRQIRHACRAGVFISYSRHDELFALELTLDLREHGLNPWLDMLDVRGDWRGEITDALDRCGLLLMIVSAPALGDRDLEAERRAFMTQGKIVLPVVYQSEPRTTGAHLPAVDFRYNYAMGLQSLIRLLKGTRD